MKHGYSLSVAGAEYAYRLRRERYFGNKDYYPLPPLRYLIYHSLDDSDSTVADLMTDGCNMGVKSLNRYLNQYKAADEYTKDITKRLINLEQQLTLDIRQYL